MHKIKDNGRTLKIQKRKNGEHGCSGCQKSDIFEVHCIAAPSMFGNRQVHSPYCGYDKGRWRETIPSRISRFIKRMVKRCRMTVRTASIN